MTPPHESAGLIPRSASASDLHSCLCEHALHIETFRSDVTKFLDWCEEQRAVNDRVFEKLHEIGNTLAAQRGATSAARRLVGAAVAVVSVIIAAKSAGLF